jgi:predicted alpha/beta superfamily hydrolase
MFLRRNHMRHNYLAALCVSAMMPILAVASAPEQAAGEPVTIGHRYQIESKVLQETRSYVVHKPRRYDFSDDRYPVVILLDGDSNMHHVSATMDQLTSNQRAMPMLVVGIENTDRQRDLTPPILSENPDDRPEHGLVGGAPKFLSFIADELLPHLDRTYRTRPTRILIGHSYGGLFAVHTLFNRPEVFKAYIVISPSLWWDNQALARQADQFAAAHKDLQTSMYVTMGNEDGAMLGGTQKVVGSLVSADNGIQVTFERWPEESHGSVVMRSVYEGMEWLHELYYTHDPVREYEVSGLQSFDKRFSLISKNVGYEVKVPEHVLMQVQHYLMEQKRPQEAQHVLQRVLDLYPVSPGAHYELGRAYLATDDRPRAEEELKRAVEIYPGHAGARSELEKLGIDASSIVTEAVVSPTVLSRYVGEYRYADETSIVTMERGKLFMKIGNDKRELRARSNVSFFAIESDREYTFNSRSDRTTSLTVQLPEFRYESRKVK